MNYKMQDFSLSKQEDNLTHFYIDLEKFYSMINNTPKVQDILFKTITFAMKENRRNSFINSIQDIKDFITTTFEKLNERYSIFDPIDNSYISDAMFLLAYSMKQENPKSFSDFSDWVAKVSGVGETDIEFLILKNNLMDLIDSYAKRQISTIEKFQTDDTRIETHKNKSFNSAELSPYIEPTADIHVNITEEDIKSPPPSKIKVFNEQELTQQRDELLLIKKDNRNGEYIKHVFELALRNSGYRDGFVFTPELQDQFDRLRKKYPNGVKLIDQVHANLISMWLSGSATDGARLLVNGPPGIGKTALCKELAQLAGLCFESFDVSTASCGMTLIGSDARWSGAAVGSFFKLASQTTCATLIAFLDEVDKIRGSDQYPIEPVLLQLLEPNNSRSIRDEYTQVSFDTSKWIIVASANELGKISAPLLSRFRVVEMEAPTEEQLKEIVHAMAQEFAFVTFSNEALDEVAKHASDCRLAKAMLAEAAEQTMLQADLPRKLTGGGKSKRPLVTVEMINASQGNKQNRRGPIGFI